MISNMKATPLVRRRIVLARDAFAEVVIWRLAEAEPPARHSWKYRLAYVVGGTCVVRFDNERGKGDHRHVGAVESAYAFHSSEQLLADFETEIVRWSDEHGRP